MTASTVAPIPAVPAFPEARSGSRAARNAMPRAIDAFKAMANEYGVCARPIMLRRTDLGTGQTEIIDLPCGATREDKCPACAARAKRLRQVQIREGWHRTDEPNPGPAPATEEQKALITLRAHFEFERDAAERNAQWDQVDDLDAAIREVEKAIAAEGLRGRIAPPREHEDEDQEDEHGRRVRSTKRRQDVPDLPRQKVEARTVGRTYTAPDGTVHQPSMWLTLTLDSYGPIHGPRTTGNGRSISCACKRIHASDDPLNGTPVDPAGYDYRRAAWDAIHFPRLLDRYWQNLRRCVGWNVQYAGCVEPQRRLAPHAHFAIRGTITRTTLERVAAATYHQVWWPVVDEPIYTLDRLPVWDGDQAAWVDPDSRAQFVSWTDALAAIDEEPDTEPAHVVRFGAQVRPRASSPAPRTSTGRSAISRSTSPRTRPTATPPAPRPSATTSTGSGAICASRRARTGARTGFCTASHPRRHTPSCGPATARARRTSAPPSVSAADASWSPVTGPARPSPTTGPTPAPGSSPCSASARVTRTANR